MRRITNDTGMKHRQTILPETVHAMRRNFIIVNLIKAKIAKINLVSGFGSKKRLTRF
jgi:hypothetical protein